MTDAKKDINQVNSKPIFVSPLKQSSPFSRKDFGKQKFGKTGNFHPTTFRQTQHKG